MNCAQVGRWGEMLALQEYEHRGFHLVAKNWRCNPYEIDLIVKNDRYLVFCEVKTRRGERFGSALESLQDAQIQRLVLAAEAYLAQYPTPLQPRMDVCAIQYAQRKGECQCLSLTIIDNAFA